jgi:hypothetical protein
MWLKEAMAHAQKRRGEGFRLPKDWSQRLMKRHGEIWLKLDPTVKARFNNKAKMEVASKAEERLAQLEDARLQLEIEESRAAKEAHVRQRKKKAGLERVPLLGPGPLGAAGLA